MHGFSRKLPEHMSYVMKSLSYVSGKIITQDIGTNILILSPLKPCERSWIWTSKCESTKLDRCVINAKKWFCVCIFYVDDKCEQRYLLFYVYHVIIVIYCIYRHLYIFQLPFLNVSKICLELQFIHLFNSWEGKIECIHSLKF